MVGLTIARDKNDHRTMIAAFGDYGLNNGRTIERIFDDQDYITAAFNQGSSNNFYELEGGVLIGEILRLSTGVGHQLYNEQAIASIKTESISKVQGLLIIPPRLVLTLLFLTWPLY